TGLTNVPGVGQDIFLAKFTTDGNLVWNSTWGNHSDAALGAAVGPDGSIFVTGNTSFGSGGGDLFVVQFLPNNGNAKQAMTWGGVNLESGESVVAGIDGEGLCRRQNRRPTLHLRSSPQDDQDSPLDPQHPGRYSHAAGRNPRKP